MTEQKKESEQDIQKLQLIEQNLQNYLMQKQQLQAQLAEVDSALEELKDQTSAYKIIGNIMVSTKKDVLESDLTKKKELIELRIKNIEKQENLMKQKAKEIQKRVLGEIKDSDD